MTTAQRRFAFWVIFIAAYVVAMALIPIPGLWPFLWCLYAAPVVIHDMVLDYRSRKLSKGSTLDSLNKL